MTILQDVARYGPKLKENFGNAPKAQKTIVLAVAAVTLPVGTMQGNNKIIHRKKPQ